MKLVSEVIKALRLKQWSKNLLVFAAPIAGASFAGHVKQLIMTFLIFCLTSSLGYLYNDWKDRKSDATNPKKQNRPFASGKLGLNSAVIMASVLLLIILVLLKTSRSTSLLFITLLYIATTLSYTKWLKNIAIIEIVTVAGCFVIRALAGSISSGSPISQWLFTVIAFGAILVISGKRLAEMLNGGNTREVLNHYSESFLRALMNLGATGSLLGYSLWTFNVEKNTVYAQISFLPFLIFALRLFWVLDKGKSQLSEEFPIQDPILLVALAALASILFFVVYG